MAHFAPLVDLLEPWRETTDLVWKFPGGSVYQEKGPQVPAEGILRQLPSETGGPSSAMLTWPPMKIHRVARGVLDA